MNILFAFSWPYTPGDQAREFFDKLRAGIEEGKEFPFDCPFQIAFVRGQSSGEFVAVLVLRGTIKDDSIETRQRLDAWFEECGAPRYQNKETPTLRGRTIQTSLGEGYEVLESIEGTPDTQGRKFSSVATVEGTSASPPIKHIGQPVRKSRRRIFIEYPLMSLLPQVVGTWMATGAINGKFTRWPPVIFIFIGLALLLGSFLVYLFPVMASKARIEVMLGENLSTTDLSTSEWLFLLFAETCVLLLAIAAIIVFDIDALKLFWSTP